MPAYGERRETWTLRGGHASDLRAAISFIASCELPTDGIDEQFGNAYVIAEAGSGLVGLAGVEVYGRYGLLRSVAVLPALRNAGLVTRSFAIESRGRAIVVSMHSVCSRRARKGFLPRAASRGSRAKRRRSRFARLESLPTRARHRRH